MPILAAPLPHTPHCLPAYGHWIRRSWHAIVSRRPSRVTSLCARICRKNKNSRIRELHSDSPSTRGASFTSVVQIPMIVGILLRTLRSFHHQLVKGSRRGLPSVEHGDPPFLSSDSCSVVQIPMIVGILLRTLRSFHHQLVKGSRRGLPSVEHGDPPFLSSDSCEMPAIRQNLTFCLFVLPFTICPHIRIFSAHSKHNMDTANGTRQRSRPIGKHTEPANTKGPSRSWGLPLRCPLRDSNPGHSD